MPAPKIDYEAQLVALIAEHGKELRAARDRIAAACDAQRDRWDREGLCVDCGDAPDVCCGDYQCGGNRKQRCSECGVWLCAKHRGECSACRALPEVA
jgi:hypothetical protein